MGGKRIVVLGAGFGGITAALELRRALGSDHVVTVIDRRATFMMGLRKLWMLVGRTTGQDGERPLAVLARKGIDLRQATVRAIETHTRTVRTDQGNLTFDYLIVALGAEPRTDLVPGWSEAAFNLYETADVERLAGRVQMLTGGRVLIAILGVPYKCPPAPFEAAMLLDDLLRRRQIRSAVDLQATTPQPMSLPVVGAAGCAQVEGQLAAKQIKFTPNRKVRGLDGSAVVYDGETISADVLIAVPPHRPPAVVRESGFTMRGDWVAVDPGTLRTSIDGVFAIGDVVEIPLANGLPLPKAGVFAEAHANVAAAQIISELTGRASPPPFDGRGYCFIEMGGGRAAYVRGEFLSAPSPRVEITPPSAEAFLEKVEFERSRLRIWFSEQ